MKEKTSLKMSSALSESKCDEKVQSLKHISVGKLDTGMQTSVEEVLFFSS